MLSSLDSWEILEKKKNNKEKIQKNHLNDLHHLTHKTKIWEKSSTLQCCSPRYFRILPWLGQLVLARFLGIKNLNIWQIVIIGLSGVLAQTLSEDPQLRERNYETAPF